MSESVKITWLGHSCFKMEYAGWSLVTDPYADGSVPGLGPVRETAGAVYCSHGHSDHNARENVTLDGREPPEDFSVETFSCPHDDEGGARRGDNLIHVFTFGALRVVHMGDAGCFPAPQVMEKLRGADLMLVPVGGYYTVDSGTAREIVRTAGPRVTVPMHYRSEDPAFGFDVLSTVELFAAFFDPEEVIRPEMASLELTETGPAGVVILTPRLAEK